MKKKKDGRKTSSWFQWPTGLVVDNRGTLYIADYSNHQIRKVSRNGVVSTFAGSGLPGHADGVGTDAMFHGPDTVVMDSEGNLLVADSDNFRIRKITPKGLVTTIAGSGHAAYRDGRRDYARFRYPTGIAIDKNGVIFVADRGSHTIRKITPDGMVTTLAGDGTRGHQDGIGTQARFRDPISLVPDNSNGLYVVDAGNHCIRKITPGGRVITFAGGRLPGYRNGRGAEARFHWPTGIALDPNGFLYVSDSNNSRIRKISPEGVVTTLAGSGVPGYSDGPARTARFNFPSGLGFDRVGNLYIADSANHLIRTITPGYREFVRQDHGDSHDHG